MTEVPSGGAGQSARAGGDPFRDKGTRAMASFAAERHIANYAIMKAQAVLRRIEGLL